MADVDQEALAESIDLTREERVRILVAVRDLEQGRYWEVLGLVSGDPTVADVKKAFLAATKVYHPDRYFGKKLGSFKERLEKLFQGVRRVWEDLDTPDKLAAYKAKHPLRSLEAPSKASKGGKAGDGGPTPSAVDPVAERQRQERLEAHRQQILTQRQQQKGKPIQEREQRAKELFESGMDSLRKKDMMAAARDLSLAAAFAPQNAEYVSRAQEVTQTANAGRAKVLFEAAETEAAGGQYATAAEQCGQAAELQPQNAAYAQRAAELHLKANDITRAALYADRALKAGPRRLDIRLVAAEIAKAKGDKAAAVAHLEVAASLDKGDARVKKMLKELNR